MQPTTAGQLHQALVAKRAEIEFAASQDPEVGSSTTPQKISELVGRKLDQFSSLDPQMSAEQAIGSVRRQRYQTNALKALGWTTLGVVGAMLVPGEAKAAAEAVKTAFLFSSPDLPAWLIPPLLSTGCLAIHTAVGMPMGVVNKVTLNQAEQLLEPQPERQPNQSPWRDRTASDT